jgi:hypothetical protein
LRQGLAILGWCWIHNLHSLASWVLGLWACATMPGPNSGNFFFAVLGFELRASTLAMQALYHLRHSTSPVFGVGYFQDRASWTICPGWLRNAILLISASQVARITGVSHWCPDQIIFNATSGYIHLYKSQLKWTSDTLS